MSARVMLFKPRNSANIGQAMRACACFGVDDLYLFDCRIPQKEVLRVSERVAKHKTVNRHPDRGKVHLHFVNEFPQLQEKKTFSAWGTRVCIERNDNATALESFHHPEDSLYVFGPENGSIPEGVVNTSEHVVAFDSQYCVNLGAAVYITLYDRSLGRGK